METEDEDLLRKQAQTREYISLGAMLLGSVLGMVGFWMYLHAGGTLISHPKSSLYWVPMIPSCILMVWGWISLTQ